MMFYVLIYIITVIYNLFSTPLSLNLVGLHLFISFTEYVILLTLFFPHFRLSVDLPFRAMVVNSSYCFSTRWFSYSIHWTVMLLLYYILSSIYCIMIIRLCITILCPNIVVESKVVVF